MAKGDRKYGNGLHRVYLPVNQAYLLMWYSERIAGPFNSWSECDAHASDLLRKAERQSIVDGRHKDWSVTV